MPRVAFACRLRLHIVGAVVDGQLQCVHTGTAVGVVVMLLVSSGCSVSLTVPSEALARGLSHDSVCAVVDGQFQRVHAGAAVDIVVSVGVSS